MPTIRCLLCGAPDDPEAQIEYAASSQDFMQGQLYIDSADLSLDAVDRPTMGKCLYIKTNVFDDDGNPIFIFAQLIK